MMRSSLLLCAVLACLATPSLGMAAPTEKPKGEVVLTIDGAIASQNDGTRLDLDMAMLQALPRTSIQTSTPWTKGVVTFEGVRLSDLLAAAGTQGHDIRAVALNDYAVSLPATDARDDNVLVAYALDGKAIPVREKGPLWIIYPFDDRPDLKTETIYSRCIWQLRQLTISR